MSSAPRADQSTPSGSMGVHVAFASALDVMGAPVTIPAETVLFEQGQPPKGVFVLRKGKVRLSCVCADGHRSHRIVGPGHVIGLLATVSDQPYLKTAQAVEDAEFGFVDRNQVMGLLSRRADFWFEGLAVLSDELKLIRRQVSKANHKIEQNGIAGSLAGRSWVPRN